jgi:PAS domain-containing protein
MLGALGEDHNDDAWNAAIHPEDLDRVTAAYDRIRSGHILQLDLNYRLRGPGGDWLHIVERSHIAAAHAAAGGAMLRGVTIDVTGPRRIEHALAQSRERFQLALECANIGFYEWDLANDAALGLEAWCASLRLPLTQRRAPFRDLGRPDARR